MAVKNMMHEQCTTKDKAEKSIIHQANDEEKWLSNHFSKRILKGLKLIEV